MFPKCKNIKFNAVSTQYLQTAPPTMKNSDYLPSIIVDTPEDDSDDETFRALMSNKSKKDENAGEGRSFNNLAPDDAVSNAGSR